MVLEMKSEKAGWQPVWGPRFSLCSWEISCEEEHLWKMEDERKMFKVVARFLPPKRHQQYWHPFGCSSEKVLPAEAVAARAAAGIGAALPCLDGSCPDPVFLLILKIVCNPF